MVDIYELFVAPFACDGELLGVGSWNSANLSPDWLTRCQPMVMVSHRETPNLEYPFDDYSVRCTSADGVALLTFSYQNTVAATAVVSNGLNRPLETEVFQMFLDSLRNVELVRLAEINRGFDTLWSIRERPIMAVVPWPSPEITDANSMVITQFSIHFAASMMARWKSG